MINKYTEADDAGREKALKVIGLNGQLTASTDPTSHWDFSGTTKTYLPDGVIIGYDYYIECKDRKVKSDQYSTDVLEYDKMCNLRNIDRSAKHYYFMSFSDNVARLYDLGKVSIMDVFVSKLDCPVSYVEDKGIKEKLVVELPVSKAKVFKWN